MSILPYIEDPFFYFERPSRILDQQFGLALEPEDLFQPLNLNDRLLTRTPAGYLRRWRSHASENGSLIRFDKDKFQADLDVSLFKPEEVSVKVRDKFLTIEGKHEEKEDKHGFVSRHFVRRYLVPKNYDVEKIQSRLSSDGVLSITAPVLDSKEAEPKSIPIQQTGEKAKKQAIEERK